MEKCTVVVTGASGLLGRAIMSRFSSEAWMKVIGSVFSRTAPDCVKVDLMDPQQISTFIKDTKPNILIHSAAQRFPDKMQENPEAAQKLNVEATKTLATAVKNAGGTMIYISTDYVFDGKNPPYDHQSLPNPINDYGLSKLQGEKVVLEVDESNLILRIPILYGTVEYIDESAITTLFPKLKNNSKSCEMSDFEIRRPSHVQDISAILSDLSKRLASGSGSDLKGIYQWCGKEPLTKYQMVKIMAKEFDLNHDHIKGVQEASPGAPRPYDTSMDTSRLTDLKIGQHTPFNEGIKSSLIKWI